MREIKFRAWYPDEKKMEYQEAKTPVWVGDILTDNYYKPMQFTGLKDKNGKEIYEGDILMFPFYKHDNHETVSIYSVFFKNGAFRIRIKENFEPYFDQHFQDEKSIPIIIGNIYENPELIINN